MVRASHERFSWPHWLRLSSWLKKVSVEKWEESASTLKFNVQRLLDFLRTGLGWGIPSSSTPTGGSHRSFQLLSFGSETYSLTYKQRSLSRRHNESTRHLIQKTSTSSTRSFRRSSRGSKTLSFLHQPDFTPSQHAVVNATQPQTHDDSVDYNADPPLSTFVTAPPAVLSAPLREARFYPFIVESRAWYTLRSGITPSLSRATSPSPSPSSGPSPPSSPSPSPSFLQTLPSSPSPSPSFL
ncbi:hypothetical protein P692DRAFT_201871374 [Suillus brevipes Sb2]|nr:hypothetical protein P692DRAFT_201871374 [Suillus brevipes Sb2]